MLDRGALAVLLAGTVGLALSFAIEGLMQPRLRPWTQRPSGSLFLHCGVWLAAHGLLASLLGRPWFAMAAVSAFLLLLVQVSNAKLKSLREPFIFQDLDYFIDAIRHPRLYLPFLGWGRTFAATAGFVLAVLVGWRLENAPAGWFAWTAQWAGAGLAMVLAMALLALGNRSSLQVGFNALQDVRELGLLASLWCYARAEGSAPSLASPFESLQVAPGSTARPHLIAVQSESFFDPRQVFTGIRHDVLAEFDGLKASAMGHGRLAVPAWGANTVRTEFAFLSGIGEPALGVHRFNPYRKAADSGVATLASFLQRLGYRTICIHPYSASFYGRDRVFPLLGFDEFIDIRAFAEARRCGPYVGDLAVADKIASVVQGAAHPVFVFVITMENHGPLNLESPHAADLAEAYEQPAPAGCADLTIYLRHLRNADRMLGRIKSMLVDATRPAGLCWFGDHVPIMPRVYEVCGAPRGDTGFLLWRNDGVAGDRQITHLDAHRLGIVWLQAMGMCDGPGLGDGRPTETAAAMPANRDC